MRNSLPETTSRGLSAGSRDANWMPRTSRGTSALWSSCLIFFLSSQVTFAFSLWQTPDQAGQRYMKEKQYQKAMETFENPCWKAAAAYKSGQYDTAIKQYRALKTLEDQYNLGNALAQAHQYEAAIQAYEAVLKQNPKHQDARFNLDLLKKQQKNPSQDQKNSQDKQNQQDKQNSQNKPNQQNQPNAEKPQQDKKLTEKSDQQKPSTQSPTQQDKNNQAKTQETNQAKEKWLKLIPDDPGGLLKQQFLRDHLRRLYPSP